MARISRNGRNRVLADTKTLTFKALASDAELVRMLADQLETTESEVLRGHLHVALTARAPLAQAVGILWRAQHERLVQAEGRMRVGEDQDEDVVRQLVELYGALVLGPPRSAVRAPLPLDTAQAKMTGFADQQEAAERAQQIKRLLREDLGLAHADDIEALALLVLAASASV